MIKPQQRLGVFLGGVLVLILALVVIWRTIPTYPVEAPVRVAVNQDGTSTTVGMNNGVAGSGTSTTARDDQDGKDKGTIPGQSAGSTTQDLPFIDLPGRRNGNNCDSGDFICISKDFQQMTLSNPVMVTGTAVVFEGRLTWKLVLGNGEGTELAAGVVQTDGAPEGMPAPFTIRSFFPPSMAATKGEATLILYEVSLKDGSPIHVLRVPVRLNGETSTIKVFGLGPKTAEDCTTLAPISVVIPKTQFPVEASLQRLLTLRPTAQDPQEVNAIPVGTKLLSLVVKNGIATAVFSRELDQNIGGSCRVTVIREQIRQTLMQYASVKSVQILAEGKTADTTLQP